MENHGLRIKLLVLSSGFALLSMTGALSPPSRSDRDFRPNIPKAWDDAAVANWEIPLAHPAPRVSQFSEKYYYSIPQVTIYKSYPMVSPDKPFSEHLEWLRQQDPKVAFDPAKLKTKADWEEAGELVFTFSLGGYAPIPQSDLDMAAKTHDPVAARSFPRVFIREKGKLEYNVGGGPIASVQACSFCHSRETADGKLVYGVQPTIPGLYPSPGSMGKSVDERRRNMQLWYGTPWFKPDPNVDPRMTYEIVQSWHAPAAVDDREGTSFRFPTTIPNLIGLKDRKYFDHTGLHPHRSIGDLMRYSVLASGMELFTKFGDFIPGGDNNHRDLPPATTRHRFSDEQLFSLALFLYALDYPANPNRPSALSTKGERLFRSQSCGSCHTPPLYTNNMLIPVDGFKVPPDHKKKYDILDMPIGLDPYLATKTRRGTGYYKVPSLRGVWMRNVLEHNGSVTTLEDWFDPKRTKDTYTPTGFRGPNKTRAVKGHPFGLDLSRDDKKALIAFLRTL
jgi:cytochrome c553